LDLGLSAIQADNACDRPRLKSCRLKSAPRLEIGQVGFDVLDLDELLTKKNIAVYSCVRSQDIFDLMALTRDHGYTS